MAHALRELADALQYLHRIGVTHGDLQPSNLLLASDAPQAPLKIADAGLARAVLGERGDRASQAA